MNTRLPEHPWVERRDPASRATRDAVASRLDLHPRVLGSLPHEVVEAMRVQLSTGQRRALDVARVRAVELTERAEAVAASLADIGDPEVDRLVTELRAAAGRLLERLQALGAQPTR
jgi:hypothetical protein